MKKLPLDKTSPSKIPIKILKEGQFCFSELANCIKKSLKNNESLDTLKLSGITPVFKKLNPSYKENYVSVSILPSVPKVFIEIFYDQFYEYIENFLNQLRCGFRKAHPTQHALLGLLQKWQKSLTQGSLLVQL